MSDETTLANTNAQAPYSSNATAIERYPFLIGNPDIRVYLCSNHHLPDGARFVCRTTRGQLIKLLNGYISTGRHFRFTSIPYSGETHGVDVRAGNMHEDWEEQPDPDTANPWLATLSWGRRVRFRRRFLGQFREVYVLTVVKPWL